MIEAAVKKGKVYLVGAGPGDPGLITVKALECLQQADAVVYDFLAGPPVLAEAPEQAELIYVGKKGSDHTLAQAEINRLLIDLAAQGKTVVRLKGGDPFIFGRGGEEAEELVAAGVPFEVVPGVTSAIAVPAYAGIPLTHRNFTSTVAFVTGHEDPTKAESSIDWSKLATGAGTLVFLMGVKNLPHITAKLIEAGLDPDTPAALIRWGTTPDQITLTAPLTDLAGKAAEINFKPPAVLVIGKVVDLRTQLNWYETKPLFGRRIMVTRTREQAGGLSRALLSHGAAVIECPTIRLAPPEDWGPLDRALDDLSAFDWLVLTSPNGVQSLFERLFTKGLDARALAPVKLAAIGPATAEKLARFGLKPDLLPEKYVAESLLEALIAGGVKGSKVLLVRAAEARDVLPQGLAAAGARVVETAAYRTLPPAELTKEAEEALAAENLDLVTFTSSSTVTNLDRLLGQRADWFKKKIPAACIGPITAQTAEEAGFKVAVQAQVYTIDGLVQAVMEYFTSTGGRSV